MCRDVSCIGLYSNYVIIIIIYFIITDYYVLLGAEEGLFSLQANTQQDPVMEQVTPSTTSFSLSLFHFMYFFLVARCRQGAVTGFVLWRMFLSGYQVRRRGRRRREWALI